MKNTFYLFVLLFCISQNIYGQTKDPKDTEVWEPVPRIVTPGKTNNAPPSDAIVLFDGTNLDNWHGWHEKPSQWVVKDGTVTVKPGTGDMYTKQSFGNCQLHLEFRTPAKVDADGQDRGNSGVYLQDKYEVQLLDSYDNKTYPNGQAGAIYKQYIPLVNACKKPGEWQTYDIIYKAPVFNKDGIRVAQGTLTVLHNGVLIQNNVAIQGTTEYIGMPKNEAHGKGKIKLQEHGNEMSFRNIWIREL